MNIMEKDKIKKFIEKYNLKLTSQQISAVENIGMPTVLLAVPGSGKTTTLVSRIGYMIFGCGIKPENILTITYTVAASYDMKERFKNIFGDADVKFQTINALCQ